MSQHESTTVGEPRTELWWLGILGFLAFMGVQAFQLHDPLYLF